MKLSRILLAAALAAVPGAAFAQSAQPGSCQGPNTYGLPPINGTIFAGAAAQRVITQATQLFWDDYGTGTLDTTNRWVAPTASGGGSAATSAVAQTVLGSGTTAAGYSYLLSQPTFSGRNPGWVYFQQQNNIEFPVLTNAYRAWGFMSVPGSPTVAAALTNAAVFEITTDGKLRAVTYASGSRTVIADLSVGGTGLSAAAAATTNSPIAAGLPAGFGAGSQPQDSSAHRYAIYFRGDLIVWMISDGLCPDRVVAAIGSGSLGPDANTLAVGDIAIANTPAPTSTATIQVNATTVADTSNANTQLSDGTYSWRKLGIGTTGSFLPAIPQAPISGNGTGTTGAVVGTLAAAAGKTTYICGFNVQAIGGTAAVGPVTVAGLIGASQVYQGSASAAGGTVASSQFTPCMPASAANTAITITTTADGTATAVDVNSWGYQQ